MANDLPILRDELTLPDRIVLASLTHHPGFKILIRLFDSACEEATAKVIKTDPEKPDYDRLLVARQQRSRAIHEFSQHIRNSIQYHVEVATNQQTDIDAAAQLENQLQGEE